MPEGELMYPTVFNYHYSLKRARLTKRDPQLVIDDPSNTLIAQFHGGSLFKKEKAYLEVTPAGMGMLDHIVVTFIPVEVRRRDHREKPKMTWF